MSRKLLVASACVALSSTLAVFASQKAGPDPVGPTNPTELRQQGVQRTPAAADPARPQAAPVAGQPAAAQEGQWKNADHGLASCVAAANQVEIAIGEFASEKAQNDDVKKFAAMLVTDHKDYLQKLERFAPESSQGGFLIREDAREVRANNPNAPETVAGRANAKPAAVAQNEPKPGRIQSNAAFRPAAAANTGLPHMQIERELAQQCLASTKEKLGSKTGAEFDKCFIGQQIAMHMHMKDKLTVFQRHASSELSAILAAGQKKTEEHLTKAEELMANLEHGSATATEPAPGAKARDAANDSNIEKPAIKE